MSTSKEREEFAAVLCRELPDLTGMEAVEAARKLCRLAATHRRLAVAHCNGDYPAGNGERKTEICPLCEQSWTLGTVKKTGCPDCRCESEIKELVAELGLGVKFQGDPRGCTVKLQVPSGPTNDWAQQGLCVPQ